MGFQGIDGVVHYGTISFMTEFSESVRSLNESVSAMAEAIDPPDERTPRQRALPRPRSRRPRRDGTFRRVR